MSRILNVMDLVATTPAVPKKGSGKEATSWYEAMAEAWGQTLDAQANRIETMSKQLTDGGQDNPSHLTMMHTQSMKMSFLSTASHSSLQSVGDALNTMARKG